MESNIKQIYDNITKHLLEDEKPSLYLNELFKNGILNNKPFDMLFKLSEINQSPKYHPEGNVWNHVMMVVDNAAKKREESKDKLVFMWGALLHDIGKLTTTKVRKGRITSYNHDKEGEDLAKEILSYFSFDKVFINKVSKLVRWHMQPLFVEKNISFADIAKMKEEVSIKEIALLSLCDRLGRGNMTYEKKEEEKNKILNFLKISYN